MSENTKPTCVLVENAGSLLCRHCGKAWTPHDEVYFGYTKDGGPNRVCEKAEEKEVENERVSDEELEQFIKEYEEIVRLKEMMGIDNLLLKNKKILSLLKELQTRRAELNEMKAENEQLRKDVEKWKKEYEELRDWHA